MAAQDSSNANPAEPSFEEALAKLETVVRQLEEGQIGLAEGLAQYEDGVKLLKRCYQLLTSAERRIELLNRVDPDGQVHSEPLDDGALSLEEKAAGRARRRSRGASERPSPASPSPESQPPDDADASGRLF